jgi:hypothetical protein
MIDSYGKFKSLRTGYIGTLRVTKREGSGYKWVDCLALIDDNGYWVVSDYWRSNAHKKAERDLLDWGYERIE